MNPDTINLKAAVGAPVQLMVGSRLDPEHGVHHVSVGAVLSNRIATFSKASHLLQDLIPEYRER
jgi:hypothetical protein